MPAPQDGPGLWLLAGGLAVIIAACLYWGRAPFGRAIILVRRDQQPFEFWAVIVMLGLACAAIAFVAAMASAPWPAGSENWVIRQH